MSEYSITPEDEDQNEAEIDEAKLNHLLEGIKSEQSLFLAIVGGFVSSIVAAFLWALVSSLTGYQIGFMAIGVGILVGFCVGFLGKGVTMPFGIVGAFFALFGCVLGNLFAVIATTSEALGVPMMTILGSIISNPSSLISVYQDTFSPIDLLFYGIAVYYGYHGSFRKLTEDEISYAQKSTDETGKTNE